MKNLFFTLTLAVAGLLALPSASVREVRANAVIGTVTASSVPLVVMSIGAPPATKDMILPRLDLSEVVEMNAHNAGFFSRLGAWFNRNGCRARIVLNFGRSFEIELDGHTHLVSWSDCNAMRAS